MPQYQLKATYVREGEIVDEETAGPWEFDEGHRLFASGFLLGIFAERYKKDPSYAPQCMKLETLLDEEETAGPQIVGQLVAEASASVTHADGSTS